MIGAGPAAAQVSDADLDEARAQVAAVQAELNDLAVAYADAEAREAQIDDNIVALQRQIAESQLTIRNYREQISDRAVDMYMDAAGVGLATVFGATTPSEVGTRNEYVGNLGRLDAMLVNSFTIRVTQFESEQDNLTALQAEQAAIVGELETLGAELNTRLEAASAEYADLHATFLEEERARQIEAERRARAAAEAAARAATSTTTTDPSAPPPDAGVTTTTVPSPPPSDTSGQVCPINGFNSFTDTWGAPRSGGRFHQGVDMLAARGTPVVAVEAGSVKRLSTSSLGGITVWLRGDSGDEFYYAHLDSWAPGLATGQRVVPGSALGTVGTTGNAPENVPHLHWEYHPGGGGAVNPTPLARSLCG
jgi:murein DD-endopeptidase MepM/ murein hydrolase activator NlpD